MDTTLLPFPHSPLPQQGKKICVLSSSLSSEKHCLWFLENWTPVHLFHCLRRPKCSKILTVDRHTTNLWQVQGEGICLPYVVFHSASENPPHYPAIAQRGFSTFICKPIWWKERREIICMWLWPVMTLNCGQSRMVYVNSKRLYSAYYLSDSDLALCIH